MCSAIAWSSEIVLRKPPLAGCGAAVRKQISEAWLPSTSGCETPLKTVKSLRSSRQLAQVGRQLVVRARLLLGRNRSGSTPEVVADGQHPPRRAARVGAANAGRIALSNGRPRATPAPRRKWRRDRALLAKGMELRCGLLMKNLLVCEEFALDDRMDD